MAQINLLKQNKPSAFGQTGLLAIFSKVAMVGLLALVAYYAWTFFRLRAANKSIQDLTTEINRQKQALAGVKKRDEVLTRQAQLKEQDALITKHVYWSQLLPELAKVTLKQAAYLSFKAEDKGTLGLSVQVSSLVDLDKFLQIFDSTKLNKYFSDLKVGGISKLQDKNKSYVKVDVQLKYSPELLKYQAVK